MRGDCCNAAMSPLCHYAEIYIMAPWTKPLRGSRVLQSPVLRYLIRLPLVRRKQSSHFQ
jgi:hypothetical protein